MPEFALTPYFHPTTVCFIDDNEAFLHSLELELPRSWACRMFSDPEAALAFLETPVELPPLMDRCFTMQRGASEAIIRLDLDLIEQEINHGDRFRRNSVVIVDYSMPSMNGLDFCAALSDPYIRKAMLTGVADEKVAVEAFNAGLIHRFIPKQQNQPISVIHDFVDELQQQYFAQYSSRLKTALAIDPPAFLTDHAVADFVGGLIERENLVEYYLCSNPPGLLMLKANGVLVRLVILSEQELDAQAEFAAAHGAPARIVRALRRHKLLICLSGDTPEDYFGEEAFDWQEKALRTKQIRGAHDTFYAGIWQDMPADINFDPAQASYNAYLATL